jgi:hypothetical protein
MCHNGGPGSWYRLWCTFEASAHMERATGMYIFRTNRTNTNNGNVWHLLPLVRLSCQWCMATRGRRSTHVGNLRRKMMDITQHAHVVRTLQTCISEVPGSHPGRNSANAFWGFPQSWSRSSVLPLYQHCTPINTSNTRRRERERRAEQQPERKWQILEWQKARREEAAVT